MHALTHCYRCNYDLAGLPASHHCPECGFEYDDSMFLLLGWRLPPLGKKAAVRIALPLLTCAIIGGCAFGLSSIATFGLVSLAALLFVAAYALSRHSGESGERALVQYLITEDGIIGPTGRLHHWQRYSHPMLLREPPARWRLHIYPNWLEATFFGGVNAVLDCTESEAEAVRDEVERRIRRAQGVELSNP